MFRSHTENQSGKSMLELISIVAIMAVLAMGTIAMYRYIMDTVKANALYDDIRMKAALNSERKASHVDWGGDTTTYGHDISLSLNTPSSGYFLITVKRINSSVCRFLLKQDWTSTSGTNNQNLSAQRIYINNEPYEPTALPTVCPEDDVDFSVAYRSSKAKIADELPRMCDNDAVCEDCHTCIGGQCAWTCQANEICDQNHCCPIGYHVGSKNPTVCCLDNGVDTTGNLNWRDCGCPDGSSVSVKDPDVCCSGNNDGKDAMGTTNYAACGCPSDSLSAADCIASALPYDENNCTCQCGEQETLYCSKKNDDNQCTKYACGDTFGTLSDWATPPSSDPYRISCRHGTHPYCTFAIKPAGTPICYEFACCDQRPVSAVDIVDDSGSATGVCCSNTEDGKDSNGNDNSTCCPVDGCYSCSTLDLNALECEDDQITKCKTNFYLQDNACYNCPELATCDGIKVVSCEENFVVVGNTCSAACTGAKPWMQVKFNQDTLPRYITEGVCRECTFTGAHTTIDEESCNECAGLRFLSKDLVGDPKCYYCGDNAYTVTTNKIADINIDSCNNCINRHFETGKGCVCDPNYKYTNSSGKEQCCPPGKHPEGTGCANGDPESCDGYLDNDLCTPCPEHATCDGYTITGCENDYFLEGTTCVECPTNATCDNGVITCNTGYYWANNACNACPEHATCNNGAIVCDEASGYYLVEYTCHLNDSACNRGYWKRDNATSCESCTAYTGAQNAASAQDCTGGCWGYRFLGTDASGSLLKCWSCKNSNQTINVGNGRTVDAASCNACLNRQVGASNTCVCRETHKYTSGGKTQCCDPGKHANDTKTGCVDD